MIYLFNDEAGKANITIKGEDYKYLIKVRRHKEGDEIYLRSQQNMQELYKYSISSIDARSVDIGLLSSEHKEVAAKKTLHVGWCLVDTKSIEKVLPTLSEIGVSKISFITCDRSQRNFKLDLKRFERILEASMQQSGRSTFIEFDSYKNIKEFILAYPQTKVFDFSENILDKVEDIDTVLVGCEGGFSPDEKAFLKAQDVFRLDTPMVLRSESAVVAVASKVLF